MRIFSLLISVLVVSVPTDGSFVSAQRPVEEDSIVWLQPFAPFAVSAADRDMVLVVITNDPPWQSPDELENIATKGLDDSEFWCAKMLESSVRRLLASRADLKGRLKFQSMTAGLPAELTGGEPSRLPSQVMVAICDDQYRLLSFVVGVPEAGDLATLIKLAEETSVLLCRTKDDRQTVIDRLADRSRSQIGRLWQAGLRELESSMKVAEEDGELADSEAAGRQVKFVLRDLESTYLLDSKLRFGLTGPADRARRMILEQHVETRRAWCASAIPFLAGVDFRQAWRPMVESIWGHPPITDDRESSELMAWFDLQLETSSLVMQLKPPMDSEHLPWPPSEDPRERRGSPWRTVHSQALNQPFRLIDAAQAAVLIRKYELMPIDIYQPSLARYLFLPEGKRQLHVIRQTDPPSRFAAMLKRSKSTLVKK